MSVKLTESAARKTAATVRRVERLDFPDPADDELQAMPSRRWVLVQVTAREDADGSPRNRWRYTATELFKRTAGIDGWELATEGRGVVDATLYNSFEIDHQAPGTGSPNLTGSGVDVDSDMMDASQFELQPIPIGAKVWATVVHCADDGSMELWTHTPLDFDGEC